MNLDDTKVRLLDETLDEYAGELRSAGDDTAAVTLAYTHSLHRFWRPILRMLPVAPEWSVLDVGSGLGILAFELAANLPIHVEGVDIERGFVEHARALLDRLAAVGLFAEGARTGFSVGDVCALDLADASFDLVFVRELFQFLPYPAQAVGELFRILRPGQYLCISDMDDQLRITWPPASPALERLVRAVSDVQHERGGDRQIGRKLTTYLRRGGFEINSIAVLPEAQHRVVDAGDSERSLIIEQLHAARSRVVAAGIMDVDRFDADLAALEQEEPFEEFRMSSRIVVMGRRPCDARSFEDLAHAGRSLEPSPIPNRARPMTIHRSVLVASCSGLTDWGRGARRRCGAPDRSWANREIRMALVRFRDHRWHVIGPLAIYELTIDQRRSSERRDRV